MSLKDMCDCIVKNLNYNGNSKILSFDGEKVTAKLVCEMLNL